VRVAGWRRVAGGFLQQPELDGERDELLLRPVVQDPLDLPLIGVLRFHQPTAGRPQLVDQRSVAKDEARLRRQVLQQLVLGAGQRLISRFLQGQRAEQLTAVLNGYRARCLLEGRKRAVGAERDGGGRGCAVWPDRGRAQLGPLPGWGAATSA
jgi:hypothetical protein